MTNAHRGAVVGDGTPGQIKGRLETSLTATARINPQIFVVTLRAAPGIDAVRGLRAVLKFALRRHNLRCVSAREVRK
jgi:hypothetical protein